MKHFLTCILLLLLCYLAPAYSQLSLVQPASVQNKNIQKFIQVWGLVKYRSAESIAGRFNADKVFLESVVRIKDADDRTLNEQLTLLLPVKDRRLVLPGSALKRLNNEDYLSRNINYKWIKKGRFSSLLRAQLLQLSNNSNATGKHYYIPEVHYETAIPHEPVYADYKFDSESMNLLALAKAWNAIEYLFPYKYVTGNEWVEILNSMIPVFRDISSAAAYEKAVLSLEAAIEDTHASAFLKQMKHKTKVFGRLYYPPFDYKVYDNKILIKAMLNDSVAQTTGLMAGDLITAINNVNTGKWLRERSQLLPASNTAVKDRLLSTNMDGSTYAFCDIPEKSIAVDVLRGGLPLHLKFDLLELNSPADVNLINQYISARYKFENAQKGYEELGDNVGLIRAGSYLDRDLPANDSTLALFNQKLQRKKALIFDMRAYPGSPGLFYTYIPQALGIEPFAFARYYAANLADPGSFIARKEMEVFMHEAKKASMPRYKGEIIILTSEDTQSMGEWYTMMLRQFNDHTTVLGSQTAGADGDLKRLNLPGGYQFVFTGNAIFYADGRQTQRVGIIPDVVFKPVITDMISPDDAQLKMALQLIN